MALAYADEVKDRATALLRDVGGLGTAAGLGFFEGDARRSADALQRVQRLGHAFVDLRGLDEAAAEAAIAGALSARVLVLVSSAFHVSRPAAALLRAAIDRRAEVTLGSRTHSRPAGQAVLVICPDAEDLERATRELVRVAYWDWIR